MEFTHSVEQIAKDRNVSWKVAWAIAKLRFYENWIANVASFNPEVEDFPVFNKELEEFLEQYTPE